MRITLLFVFITSLIMAQETGKAQSFLKYDADERLFTAMILWNATGNTLEYNPGGMHPVRIAIREEIEKKLTPELKKKIVDFTEANPFHYSKLGEFALLTEGGPGFKYSSSLQLNPYEFKIQQLKENLFSLYRDLYKELNVGKLWEKYRPDIQEQNDKYAFYAEKALENIVLYCRLSKDYFAKRAKSLHIQYSPLMSYYTAYLATVNNELWIISGPNANDSDQSAVYHEALHDVVNPVTEKHYSELNKYIELQSLAKKINKTAYESWGAMINECFVRTLTVIIMNKYNGSELARAEKGIEREYKLGFILCPSFYESFKKYEISSLTFENFYSTIINDINVAREKERYEEFRKKQ